MFGHSYPSIFRLDFSELFIDPDKILIPVDLG